MAVKIKQTVGASAAAFMDGKLINTQYSSGCLRYILASKAGLKSKIPKKYEIMGEMNELNFYRKLVDSNKYALILDEVEIRVPLDIGEVKYSARTDFLTLEHDADTIVVHENKSTMNSSTLGAAKRGEFRINQLAQITGYLIMWDLPLGYLHIDGYSEKNAKKNKEDEKAGRDVDYVIVPKISRDTKKPHSYTFEITFSGNDILVDGRLSGFTKLDAVNHMVATAEMLNKPYIADRPMNSEDERGACSFCDLRYVCDKTDEENLTVDEFINEALMLNEGE